MNSALSSAPNKLTFLALFFLIDLLDHLLLKASLTVVADAANDDTGPVGTYTPQLFQLSPSPTHLTLCSPLTPPTPPHPTCQLMPIRPAVGWCGGGYWDRDHLALAHSWLPLPHLSGPGLWQRTPTTPARQTRVRLGCRTISMCYLLISTCPLWDVWDHRGQLSF